MDDPYQQPYDEVAEQIGLHAQTNQGTVIANQAKQLQYQMEESEQNLAEAQLDCREILTRMYHLFKQDKLVPKEELGGLIDWVDIDDFKKRILTDEGVDTFIELLEGYVNKETLLSNFDDKIIARRMLEVSLSFSADFLLRYENHFRQPSTKECKEIFMKKIEDRIELRMASNEILGIEKSKEEIKKEILEGYSNRIEYELQKIKESTKKQNLVTFQKYFYLCIHLIEATHNRAWKGEERGSLRRHFNISEIIGGRPQQQEKKKWGLF